ncbi:MAG TPA: elongation factor 1-beta [Bacillota bacterium]|nr:elongation factor 1-beta [Bacillota bacterium]
MGITAIKMKIMPESVETDLRKVEEEVKNRMMRNNVENPQLEVQPIAFGLNALVVLFGWPEEKEFEGFEKELQKIPGVSSIEILDMRRAI